ncbi:RNA-binding S4 domain-containing protein [Jannaschia seohaensis]|uniref:Ribosome-associated heat shock protein Hsp15 n=1 Tax=Jannaschia seohaensis TaxID=475081 RepID=A0A2Y9ABF9_9RHOB|nr:RNA-binding S4 domain-containing protein [Jannaschia seohaensis]PWJ21105.1 ribosome-associated heat shock protein Hsp15 [Jannaschia seohaensis]SSA41515.1 ribosome-associated heat shock protein Hsp15 [Jannaschia seohaensis]
MSEAPARQRLDKWLWQARFFKTRSLAARTVSDGHVRVNGERVTKPAYGVAPGDTLTFAAGSRVRVIEIQALLSRRGPAPEAQAAYTDNSPAPVPRVGPRPTGRDRRRLDQARDWAEDQRPPAPRGPVTNGPSPRLARAVPAR